MELRNQIGRPLLLLMLFGAGVGVIWHIGHNLIPRQPAGGLTKAAVKQETPQPEPRAESGSEQSAPSQAAEPKPALPPKQTATSQMPSSPEKSAPPQTEAHKAAARSSAVPEKTQAMRPPAPQAGRAEEPPATNTTGLDKDLPATLKDLQSRTQEPRLLVNERGRFLSSESILFNSGLVTMRSSSLPGLEKLAALLKEKPDIKLEIAGYTDNIGVESANQKISAESAAAVKEYLVSQGIDPSRLESRGMGSKDPIASNDTQLGRQANRRIELRITSPK